jgi:hypothetical protein
MLFPKDVPFHNLSGFNCKGTRSKERRDLMKKSVQQGPNEQGDFQHKSSIWSCSL